LFENIAIDLRQFSELKPMKNTLEIKALTNIQIVCSTVLFYIVQYTQYIIPMNEKTHNIDYMGKKFLNPEKYRVVACYHS
jgi:hypothetical protein